MWNAFPMLSDHEAAQLSAVCYLEPGDSQDAAFRLGWDCLPIIEGDTEAFIFERDGETVIGFRGTSSIDDTITDLRLRKTRAETTIDPGAEVHRGFSEYVSKVFSRVFDACRSPGNRRLYVVGHSLGGAAAQILAFRLAMLGSVVARVVTFGSPRVGNKTFAQEYNRLNELDERTRRYRRVLDPVPHLPPRRWGYRHTAGERYIDRNGKIHKQIGWWSAMWDKACALTIRRKWDGKPDPIAAHGVDGYIAALKP